MTDIIGRAEAALDAMDRHTKISWGVVQAEDVKDCVYDLIAELKSAHAEINHLNSYKSLPEGMVWQDYYSPDDVNKIRTELEGENGRLIALYESMSKDYERKYEGFG